MQSCCGSLAATPDTLFCQSLVFFLAVADALSRIDLIPDFIAVLGYLDDALLLPALIWLAARLLLPHVIENGGRRLISG